MYDNRFACYSKVYNMFNPIIGSKGSLPTICGLLTWKTPGAPIGFTTEEGGFKGTQQYWPTYGLILWNRLDLLLYSNT